MAWHSCRGCEARGQGQGKRQRSHRNRDHRLLQRICPDMAQGCPPSTDMLLKKDFERGPRTILIQDEHRRGARLIQEVSRRSRLLRIPFLQIFTATFSTVSTLSRPSVIAITIPFMRCARVVRSTALAIREMQRGCGSRVRLRSCPHHPASHGAECHGALPDHDHRVRRPGDFARHRCPISASACRSRRPPGASCCRVARRNMPKARRGSRSSPG